MKNFSDFLDERCWPGYKPKPGKQPYSPGSCVKEEDMEEDWSQKYKSDIDCDNPKGFSQKAHCAGKKKDESVNEDLRNWFDPNHPKGGWKRVNSKGEVVGDCAREPGEPKPKCMSNAQRASLSKKEKASAVRRKRKEDPNPERQGDPINVKSKVNENMEQLDEKNKPTNPELWSRAIAQAKSKFDVYPCVPLDSLAISKNGPISYEDLNVGDEILSFNMKEDKLEWKPVLHKHFYENAPLIEIGKATGFSIRCTPNHKWVISKENENILVEAKDLNTHMRILMCSTLKNDSSLLIENWTKKDDWIKKVLSMDEKEREIFLASSVVYDGWDKGVSTKIKGRHTFGFSQKEYDHLWASLLAAYLNGYYVNSREKADDMTSASYIRNKKFHNTQNLYKKDAGSEDVWCPTTENETWVMIQNGLITITGNSAYANGWASKWYKERGGGWKSVAEAMEVGDDPINQGTPEGIGRRGPKTVLKKFKELSSQVKEAKEKTEYDYEGDMARGQLQSIMNNAQKVHDMLEDNDNLPEWVQSKITLSEDYISTVANYMMSELDEAAVVKTNRPIGFRVSDVGAGGKEYNVKTDKAYDNAQAKKKLPQGADFAAQRRKERLASNGRMDEEFIQESGGDVVLKKGDTHIEKYGEDSFALYKDGKKVKYYTSIEAAKEAMNEEVVQEGRPSQQHPLEGHDYHRKTNAELEYIAKDAHKAAEAMKSHNTTAENKYRDQASDSATVRHFRKTSGTPDWYKKKYGHVKEAVETKDNKPPFEGPYKKAQVVVTDKSGAKHGSMSRARDLAKQAAKRQAGSMKEEKQKSRKAQIIKNASKGNDKFEKDPIITDTTVKTDNLQ